MPTVDVGKHSGQFDSDARLWHYVPSGPSRWVYARELWDILPDDRAQGSRSFLGHISSNVDDGQRRAKRVRVDRVSGAQVGHGAADCVRQPEQRLGVSSLVVDSDRPA